jgi:hypothetical protein
MAALLFPACSADNEDAPANGIPLQVNAEIVGATTRVTYGEDGGCFDNDDYIWVVPLGEDAPLTVKYIYKNGHFSPYYSSQTIYTGTQGNTFCAIYRSEPEHSSVEGLSLTGHLLPLDMTTQDNTGDVMYASVQTATIQRPEVSFRFRHLLSKVVFRLPEGTTRCLLSGIPSISGDFDLAQGEFVEGSLSGNEEESYNLYLSSLTATGYFIPQDTWNLKVTIHCKGTSYAAHLDLYELEAGTEYDFTLEVTEGKRLEVKGNTILGFANSEENWDGTRISPMGFTDLNEIQLYDIVLSDGSFIHSEDEEALNMYASEARGIVFWLGNPHEEDTALGVGYVHGLIVALKEASDWNEWDNSWGELAINAEWDDETMSYSGYSWPDYVLALPSKGPEGFDTMQGYTNVSTWMNRFIPTTNQDRYAGYYDSYYDEYDGVEDSMSDYSKLMPAYCYAWNYSAPISVATSHWYLPSVKELICLCAGATGDYVDYWSTYGTSNKEALNRVLQKLQGMTDAQELSYGYYWSSLNGRLPDLPNSEDEYNPLLMEAEVWVVNFEEGCIENSSTQNRNAGLRAICAF